MEPSHHGPADDGADTVKCWRCEAVQPNVVVAHPTEYQATQQAVVLDELRGDVKALRAELAPVLRLVAQLQQLPKIAKALGQTR